MTDGSRQTFELREPLSRRELCELMFGVPLSLGMLCVELVRIWRGFQGEPLLLTGFTDPDLTARWSESPLYFCLVLALHSVILLWLGAVLFYLFQLGRRVLASQKQ
jgi:hypothetical protein